MKQLILIQGAHLVDSRHRVDAVMDLLVEDGKVARVAPEIKRTQAMKVVNAKGLHLLPGLIDAHVHLREPGNEEKETIATGTQCAAAGGVTTVMCMPNTQPPIDDVANIQFVLMKARQDAWVRVHPIGCVTKGREGKELTEFSAMKKAGAVAVSDDGDPIANSQLFRRALEYGKTFGLVVIDHCEDPNLFKGGVMNEGTLSMTLGLKGIPKQAEFIAVQRNLALAELTGGRTHFAHMSTLESIRAIREAKKRGVKVTAETCPHYFSLTDEAVARYNTNAKMNPPLRPQADVDAVKEGLRDGTIDLTATDHAPHTVAQKSREFDSAPFGVIGLETLLPLCLKELVAARLLTLSDIVRLTSDQPAKVFGLAGGHLGKGAPADFTLLDLKKRFTYSKSWSKSKNSPFLGWNFQGAVESTYVGGTRVFHRGEFEKRPDL